MTTIKKCLTVLSLFAFLLSYPAFALTPSLDGANIPALSQIVDAQNNLWTLDSSGHVYKNKVRDAASINVRLLILISGVIYQQNQSGGWHSYNGTGWNQVGSDPRIASLNGTNIPHSSRIIDGQKHFWVVD